MQMRPYIHRPAQPYNMPPRSSLHMFEISRTDIYVHPARSFTGFKSQTAFSNSMYICLNPFAILSYPNIYINITICLSIFSFNLSRNKAQFFSLMVSFGVIVALRRNTHWHILPVKFVELIQKLDLRRWLSVGLALFYHSFMIYIYKCLPICVFLSWKRITFSRRSIGPHVSHKIWALSQFTGQFHSFSTGPSFV